MKYLLSTLGFFAPVFALAQFGSLGDIEIFVRGLVNSIVIVLVTFIFVVFLWGMVKAIWLSVGEESKKEAYALIKYSLISLIIVLSLWSIIRIAAYTFLG